MLTMSMKKNLTNEELNDRFENPFSLVNYAISLARRQIERGYESETNPANEVLDLIASGHDMLKEEEDDEEEEEVALEETNEE